jgi:small conductance mechanosensitive channel
MLDINQIKVYFAAFLKMAANYCPKLISAFLILIFGLYVIKFFKRVLKKILDDKKLDPTLSKFFADVLIGVLRVLLFITFISELGIQTTSFVAVLGAIGLTVGLSLQGSLSNFAGGVLIIVFEPFRVGDSIEAQGVSGTVDSIQLFVTKIITGNNVAIYIPNGVLSNGNIINYSRNETRRAELFISVGYDVDLKKMKEIILEILKSNSKILAAPEPEVEIVALMDNAIKIGIKAWANNANYGAITSEILEECKTQLHEQNIDIQNFTKNSLKNPSS